jgi:hypothetical protein
MRCNIIKINKLVIDKANYKILHIGSLAIFGNDFDEL